MDRVKRLEEGTGKSSVRVTAPRIPGKTAIQEYGHFRVILPVANSFYLLVRRLFAALPRPQFSLGRRAPKRAMRVTSRRRKHLPKKEAWPAIGSEGTNCVENEWKAPGKCDIMGRRRPILFAPVVLVPQARDLPSQRWGANNEVQGRSGCRSFLFHPRYQWV
jgi:hypothetical protein